MRVFRDTELRSAGVLCAALLLCGCAGQRQSLIEMPTFRESEIRSKSWSDPDGKLVQLLSFDYEDCGDTGKLLLVAFGNIGRREAACLEVYRPKESFRPGDEKEFELLFHDAGQIRSGWEYSRLVSAEKRQIDGRVFISISREKGRYPESERLLYYLDYQPVHGMSFNISVWGPFGGAAPPKLGKVGEGEP
jgi:hypothetical protein